MEVHNSYYLKHKICALYLMLRNTKEFMDSILIFCTELPKYCKKPKMYNIAICNIIVCTTLINY